LPNRGLHDHHGAVRPSHYLFGHAAEQQVFQTGTPVRPHHDQIAPQLLEYFKDVPGVGLIRHDDLMLHANAGINRLKAVKAVPDVHRVSFGWIGQQWTAFRNHGGRLSVVEENHLRSKRSSKRLGHAKCLVGVLGKISRNEYLSKCVRGPLISLQAGLSRTPGECLRPRSSRSGHRAQGWRRRGTSGSESWSQDPRQAGP
jgi:hypothetical protein